jgi:hypothetical protein
LVKAALRSSLHFHHMVKMVSVRKRRRKQTGQIFVNASGGRRQLLALAALAVGCACLGYLLLLVAALSGVVWQDEQEPPRTAERSTTGSAPTAGAQSGAHSARPGADSARPGAHSARPGADSARPGADSARPGAHSGEIAVSAPFAAASPSGGGPW